MSTVRRSVQKKYKVGKAISNGKVKASMRPVKKTMIKGSGQKVK